MTTLRPSIDQEGQGSSANHAVPLIADAAAASSVKTAQAIGQAVEINDDPEVGKILEDAAITADLTVSRVGWVRNFLSRFSRSSAASQTTRI